MHIVGIERSEGAESEDAAVYTIDVWYSERRRAWVVERLDATGNHVGVSHACGSRVDALDCLAEWLRAHPDSSLGAPVPDEPAVASSPAGALFAKARVAVGRPSRLWRGRPRPDQAKLKINVASGGRVTVID